VHGEEEGEEREGTAVWALAGRERKGERRRAALGLGQQAAGPRGKEGEGSAGWAAGEKKAGPRGRRRKESRPG
jgi:hypothetical protein